MPQLKRRPWRHSNRCRKTGSGVAGGSKPTATASVRYLRGFVRKVVQDEGYKLHGRKKTSVRRQHHRQEVTGLVVNQQVNLPRKTRRWLRAVEHRTQLASRRRNPLDTSQPRSYLPKKRPTLTPSQLAGWQAFRSMVEKQSRNDG